MAFNAIDSRVEDVPNAKYSLASSLTNSFPTLFCGGIKQFFLQCTAMWWASSRDSENSVALYSPHVNVGELMGVAHGRVGYGST